MSYISRPLHVFGLVGGGLFSVGFFVAALLTAMYYLAGLNMQDHLGNLMFAMLLMMLGVQLVAIGLTLEVGIRTYHAAAGKRIYAVKEFLSRDGG